MKKTKKWTLISMMIGFPVIILTVSLTISGANIKDFPLWIIIGIPALILISPFTFFFAQRKAQRRPPNTPLQKRRKLLLIILGISSIPLLIISIIGHIQGISFWKNQFTNIGSILQWLLIIVIFLYAFFRKDKKKKSLEENNDKIEN